MANIKSQKKRNLQNEKAHERNKAVRSRLKTESKGARTAEAGEDELRAALRGIDKAAAKGVLHKKTAARRKSRLAKAAARSGE